MSNKNIALGFLTGAALGGLGVLLAAPDSGARTRRKIRRRALEAKDQARERITDTGDRIKGTAIEASSTVSDSVDDKLDLLRRNAAALAEAANQGYEAYRTRLEEESHRNGD